MANYMYTNLTIIVINKLWSHNLDGSIRKIILIKLSTSRITWYDNIMYSAYILMLTSWDECPCAFLFCYFSVSEVFWKIYLDEPDKYI